MTNAILRVIREREQILEIVIRSKPDLQARFGVQFHQEDLLGRPMDLVTEKALRSELRPYVEQEKVDI